MILQKKLGLAKDSSHNWWQYHSKRTKYNYWVKEMIWHGRDPFQHYQLRRCYANKEIEEEYHLLPQINAKKKDPVPRK